MIKTRGIFLTSFYKASRTQIMKLRQPKNMTDLFHSWLGKNKQKTIAIKANEIHTIHTKANQIRISSWTPAPNFFMKKFIFMHTTIFLITLWSCRRHIHFSKGTGGESPLQVLFSKCSNQERLGTNSQVSFPTGLNFNCKGSRRKGLGSSRFVALSCYKPGPSWLSLHAEVGANSLWSQHS